MIHVAIADDEGLFRRGMRELLDDGITIRFCMEAGNGVELLEQLEKTHLLPDVLLLDISMPQMNGLETFGHVREKYPAIKILILSILYNHNYIFTFIEMGANGYLSKNAEPEEVEKAIHAVMKNDFYFNDETFNLMYKNFAARPQVVAGVGLSEREQEVLKLICSEDTAEEIAEKLFLSRRTVEGHRNNLLLKTGCRNSAGLVVYAIKHNIFKVDRQDLLG